MPGGTASILFGKWTNVVNAEVTFKDPTGRWHAIELEANGKSLMIITVYRITENSGQGLKTVKAQLDKVTNKIQSLQGHRKEMLKDLI